MRRPNYSVASVAEHCVIFSVYGSWICCCAGFCEHVTGCALQQWRSKKRTFTFGGIPHVFSRVNSKHRKATRRVLAHTTAVCQIVASWHSKIGISGKNTGLQSGWTNGTHARTHARMHAGAVPTALRSKQTNTNDIHPTVTQCDSSLFGRNTQICLCIFAIAQ
jgi:hypothetical protein